MVATRRGVLAGLITVGMLAGTVAAASASPLMALFDSNHDQRVSLAEYQAYMDRGFTRMDTNGDEILEADEFPLGTHHRGPLTLRAHHRHVARQFKRQDVNHDGYLDARELAAPPR